MAERSEKHNFLLVILVLIGVQLPCLFIPIPYDDPFWARYAFGAAIDSIAFSLIYLLITSPFRLYMYCLLFLQSLSLFTHLGGWWYEQAYIITKNEEFAQLCNLYTPILRVILCLKMIVLGWGGYGIYRRTRNESLYRRDYPVGIVIPRPHTVENTITMVEEQK